MNNETHQAPASELEAPDLSTEPTFQVIAKLRGALLLLRDAHDAWNTCDQVQFADRLIANAIRDMAALCDAIDVYTTYHGHAEHLRKLAAEGAAAAST